LSIYIQRRDGSTKLFNLEDFQRSWDKVLLDSLFESINTKLITEEDYQKSIQYKLDSIDDSTKEGKLEKLRIFKRARLLSLYVAKRICKTKYLKQVVCLKTFKPLFRKPIYISILLLNIFGSNTDDSDNNK